MGAILASATINRAQLTLLDDVSLPGGGEATWNSTDPDELLKFYNASVRLIVLYKPDTGIVVGSFPLVAGARQQAEGTFIGAFSNAAGGQITQMDMDDADHLLPNWRQATPAATRHWMADRKEPEVFWVYPPAVAAAVIEASRVVTPAPILATAPNPLNDAYEQVIYWLILAHAYAKNAKRGDMAKMNGYLQLAGQALGVKRQIQLQQSPSPVAVAQAAP